MTTADMRSLVREARAFERAQSLLEKNERMRRSLNAMLRRGADARWVEEQRAELTAARRTLQMQAQEWQKAHERLNCIVMGAQDEMIRCILSRYYLHGDSWQQVAAHVGGGNSPDGVRKLAARYLASLH